LFVVPLAVFVAAILGLTPYLGALAVTDIVVEDEQASKQNLTVEAVSPDAR
jgi:hypothetical protein